MSFSFCLCHFSNSSFSINSFSKMQVAHHQYQKIGSTYLDCRLDLTLSQTHHLQTRNLQNSLISKVINFQYFRFSNTSLSLFSFRDVNCHPQILEDRTSFFGQPTGLNYQNQHGEQDQEDQCKSAAKKLSPTSTQDFFVFALFILL